MSRKSRKKLEHKEKITERRDKFLEHDFSSERAVLEEVFDVSTLMTVYHFLNKGVIDEIHGVVNSGKESRIYWGKHAEDEVAIKIYLTVSAEFRKGLLKYIEGDYRFKNVRRGTRSLIYAWARKEFRNLEQALSAKVRVPKPITVKKNVLLMEFIGKNGVSAPTLKEWTPRNPENVYKSLLASIKRLYLQAALVHGDLSEYNVMIWKERPVLFDMSQAVPLSHPMADSFLKRDLINITHFFSAVGVNVLSPLECYRKVTGHGKS